MLFFTVFTCCRRTGAVFGFGYRLCLHRLFSRNYGLQNTRRLFKTVVPYKGTERKNVNGCVGVVLAVNGEAVESRNMSNDCALNRSQKRCFITFYLIFFYS